MYNQKILTNYANSRVVITGDRPEFQYNISPGLLYRYVYVEAFAIPACFSQLPATTILFIDGVGAPHTITFSAGTFSIDTFGASLVAQMDIAYPAGAPYTFARTAAFTWFITSTAGTFSLSIANPVFAQRVGLIAQVASIGQVLTSQRFNVGISTINIESNLPICGQSTSYDNITPPAGPVSNNIKSGSSLLACLALASQTPIGALTPNAFIINSGSFGTHHKLMTSSPVNSINIRITDELGLLLDTYPQRWTLVLVFYNAFQDPAQ